uniref:Sjoegren syndrome nuclear autoantigen 1 homolog n=1 Tax=Schistocephalus solidus TaxID=70667 RepID=A0A0X3PT98_SCHSO
MSQQGAALQNYNNELVKCFEDLCKRREEIQRLISLDEAEKAKLQREINILTEKLHRVNEALQKKLATRNEYDRTIAESEAAYMKVYLSTILAALVDPRKFSDPSVCFEKRRSRYSATGCLKKCAHIAPLPQILLSLLS